MMAAKATMSDSITTSPIVKGSSQVLKFKEPTTNVTVILIGAMHYNPASIELVRDTIETLGQENKLGSVIIESCDIRWNDTSSSSTPSESEVAQKEFKKKFLQNEMRVA